MEHWPAVIVASVMGVVAASAVAIGTLKVAAQHTFNPPGNTTSVPAVAHR